MLIATSSCFVFCMGLHVFLTWRVIQRRRALGVALGSGGDKILEKRIRAQANLGENAPLFLIGLALYEWGAAESFWVLSLSSVFVLGRALHAYGVSMPRENLNFRVSGTTLSFLAMIGLLLSHLYRLSGSALNL